MILTTEEKILLAEKVMGLQLIDPDQVYKVPSIQTGAGYYFLKDSRMMITDGSFLHNWWQPETDEGDAARLLVLLPHAAWQGPLSNGNHRVFTSAGKNAYEEGGFCKVICTAALDYAREKVAKRWRKMSSEKPLNSKAYGSIPHLPGSRMGPGDHHCTEGMAKILTEKPRDKHDIIIAQEKLDGSCCAVAKMNGVIVPLTRSGYHASTSPYEQHHLFAGWVEKNEPRFFSLLNEGERVVGEWLAQAHGTRYELQGREPFVAFDLFTSNNQRVTYAEFSERTNETLYTPTTIIKQGESVSLWQAEITMNLYGHYGALDPIEGFVWRVERMGKVDFLAKYVRPDKVDGCFLPQISGLSEVWNWRPLVEKPPPCHL